MDVGERTQDSLAEDWSISAAAALDDPTRRAMYDFIRRARRPITREEAAAHVGISRKLAAFHLDKMVDLGLLVSRPRVSEDGARKTGRAPKVYEPAEAMIKVVIPAREPDVLAKILLDTVADGRSDERAVETAMRVGHDHGWEAGHSEHQRQRPGRLGVERATALARTMMRRRGYEPSLDPDGVLRLNNCPFHPLAEHNRDLVCNINLAYLSGMLDGLGAAALAATLAPRSGFCCVEVAPAPKR
jgi:predicted ArsR family transcriptional regulator